VECEGDRGVSLLDLKKRDDARPDWMEDDPQDRNCHVLARAGCANHLGAFHRARTRSCRGRKRKNERHREHLARRHKNLTLARRKLGQRIGQLAFVLGVSVCKRNSPEGERKSAENVVGKREGRRLSWSRGNSQRHGICSVFKGRKGRQLFMESLLSG